MIARSGRIMLARPSTPPMIQASGMPIMVNQRNPANAAHRKTVILKLIASLALSFTSSSSERMTAAIGTPIETTVRLVRAAAWQSTRSIFLDCREFMGTTVAVENLSRRRRSNHLLVPGAGIIKFEAH